MDKNVLAYEPHLALFVPQAEPLLFYQAISHYARHALKPNGYLYFEANPLYIEELQVLLCQKGFNDIAVRDDQFGRRRFIMGRKGHQETTAYEKDIF
jgi:release factor glutamine methyltransferase